MTMSSSYPTTQGKSIPKPSKIPTPKRNFSRISVEASGSSYTQISQKKSRVKVVARIRPLLGEETRNLQGCRLISSNDFEDSKLTVSDGNHSLSNDNGEGSLPQMESFRSKSTYLIALKDNFQRKFDFDAVFSASATQEDVYEHSVGDAVRRNIFRGFNTTILAHGQSGSGKTYTMSGFQESEMLDGNSVESEEYSIGIEDGIIPRAIYDLFQAKKRHESSNGTMSICLTYVEINNEEIRDLLADEIPETQSGSQLQIKSLRLRDTGNDSFYIESLESVAVDTAQQVYELIEYGSSRRQTASTALNDNSNSSHSICTLNVTLTQSSTCKANDVDNFENDSMKTIKSKLTMVDLAGSERVKELKDGTIAKARINVNKDLFTMTRVIGKLAALKSRSVKREKDVHIPYRDSKITCLLRDSIGGNCYTIMIACVSPTNACFEESMNTLKYAEQTKQITVNPHANLYKQNLERAANENRMLRSKLSEMRRRDEADNNSMKGLADYISRSSSGHVHRTGSVDTTETESSLGSKLSSSRNIILVGEKLDLDIEKKKVTLERLTREVSQAEELLRTKGSLIESSLDPSLDLNGNKQWQVENDNLLLDGELEKRHLKEKMANQLEEMEDKREAIREEISRLETRLQQLSRQVHYIEQDSRSQSSGGVIGISDDINEVIEKLRDELRKTKADARKIEVDSEAAFARINGLEDVEKQLRREIDDLRSKLSTKTKEVTELEECKDNLIGEKKLLMKERDDALSAVLFHGAENEKLQRALQEKDKIMEEMRLEMARMKEERNAGVTVEPPVHVGGSISVKSNLTNEDHDSIASNDTSQRLHRQEVTSARILCTVNKEISKGFMSGGFSVASSVGSSKATEFRPNMKEVYAILNGGKGDTSGKPPLSGHTNFEKDEQIYISNMEEVSDGNRCTCKNSKFSGNAEYVNFYLPKLGMACTCGKCEEEIGDVSDGDDPLSLKGILRSWQVEFLATQRIHGALDLVYAFKQRNKELSRAMRIWRKQKGLPAVKTKSCHAALLIWYRTCKAVVRSIRRQKIQGAKVLKKPNFLGSTHYDDSKTVSSLGGHSTQLIDMNLELET